MVDMLSQGAAWLNTTRAAHMVSPITYYRGSELETLSATRGSSRFELATADGTLIQVEMHDFVITAADVDPLPQPGDRIVCGRETFEVAPVGDEPCFRNSDEFGNALRIHTKKVSGI